MKTDIELKILINKEMNVVLTIPSQIDISTFRELLNKYVFIHSNKANLSEISQPTTGIVRSRTGRPKGKPEVWSPELLEQIRGLVHEGKTLNEIKTILKIRVGPTRISTQIALHKLRLPKPVIIENIASIPTEKIYETYKRGELQ